VHSFAKPETPEGLHVIQVTFVKKDKSIFESDEGFYDDPTNVYSSVLKAFDSERGAEYKSVLMRVIEAGSPPMVTRRVVELDRQAIERLAAG
jgi:hypothetical protein